MTPMEKIEKYRKPIGWLSIAMGVCIFVALGFIAKTVSYNRGRIENNLTLVREQLSTLQLALLQKEGGGRNLPIVTYMLSGKSSTAVLVNWPLSAENLLGWTSGDILQYGIAVIMPERYRKNHTSEMEASLDNPSRYDTQRSRNVFALHKDGHEVPVRITTWVTSDGEIKTANAIIRERDTETQLSMEN